MPKLADSRKLFEIELELYENENIQYTDQSKINGTSI